MKDYKELGVWLLISVAGAVLFAVVLAMGGT